LSGEGRSPEGEGGAVSGTRQEAARRDMGGVKEQEALRQGPVGGDEEQEVGRRGETWAESRSRNTPRENTHTEHTHFFHGGLLHVL